MCSYPVRLDNNYLSEPPPPLVPTLLYRSGRLEHLLIPDHANRFNSNMYMNCIVKFHVFQRLNILPGTCILNFGLRADVY